MRADVRLPSRLIGIAVILISFNTAQSVEPGDHLIPSGGAFADRGRSYEADLRKQLLVGTTLPQKVVRVSAFVQPAFDSEWRLAIAVPAAGKRCIEAELSTVIGRFEMEHAIRRAKQSHQIETAVTSGCLPVDVGTGVVRAMQFMVKEARYGPCPDLEMVRHPVRYHFVALLDQWGEAEATTCMTRGSPRVDALVKATEAVRQMLRQPTDPTHSAKARAALAQIDTGTP